MQAEQLLELELSSGFGDEIEAAAAEAAAGRKEIRLVFGFDLESDALATENNVKKSTAEKKDKADHQQTEGKSQSE